MGVWNGRDGGRNESEKSTSEDHAFMTERGKRVLKGLEDGACVFVGR